MHFRNYDKQGLDAQYNLREVVPTYQGYFDQWDKRSQDVRDCYPRNLDVPYGSAPLECLDIFPSGRQNSPAMVFIHGGYWQGSDKSQFSFLAQGFIPTGITFIAVNYSLAHKVGMDEIVHQNRRALTWVWQHAEEFGYNSDRIFVSGHSAGGHLVSLLASTDWPNFAPGLPPDLIKGICSISGIFDLEPVRCCYLNAVLEMDEEVSKRNSPIIHLPELEIPLILSVGGLETEEFQRQSEEYAARWRSKRLPLEVVAMPGFHHYSVVDELANPASPLNRAVISQISRVSSDPKKLLKM